MSDDSYGLESLEFNDEDKGFRKNDRKMYLGFFKKRQKKTSIKVGEVEEWRWHDLKTFQLAHS
jgi:hypothetical protein